MGARIGLALLFLGSVVAACATSPGPSQRPAAVPSGSPHVAIVSPDPSSAAPPSAKPATSGTPAPTPGPLTIKKAGKALLAAMGRRQEAWEAGGADKYRVSDSCSSTPSTCSAAEWKLRREVAGIQAAALGTYVRELKLIRFPAVAAPAAAAYLKSAINVRDRYRAASKATTLETFNTKAAAASKALDGKYVDNEQLLLDALGLPVGP